MAFDFNGAEQQREGGLIADGTIAVVHLTVRPGNAGEGGWLKRSKDGSSQALDCEFTVVDGPSAKRKFWSLFTVEGTTEGHAKAADISASRLRGILESAKGIRPDDESEAAKAGRVSTHGVTSTASGSLPRSASRRPRRAPATRTRTPWTPR
jgi:hypothetical protein